MHKAEDSGRNVRFCTPLPAVNRKPQYFQAFIDIELNITDIIGRCLLVGFELRIRFDRHFTVRL